MNRQVLLFISIIFLPISLTVSGIFLLILLINLLIKKDVKEESLNFNSKITKLWYLFIIFSLVQGIFSINPLFHYAGLIGHYLLYFLIFWIAFKTIKTEKDFNLLIISFILSGVLVSIIGIFSYFGLKPDIKLFYIPLYGGDYLINLQFPYFKNRASSFSMNPNNLGCYLILTSLITLGSIKNKFGQFINYPIKIIDNKYVYTAFLLLQFTCLFLTFSRGAIISISFGVFLFILLSKNFQFKFILPIILGVVLLFFTFSEHYIFLVKNLFNLNYFSNALRLQTWQICFNIIKDFPAGVGILNYESIYPYYLGSSFKYISHAHNWVLHTTIESGILGMIIFFSFYFYIILDFFQKLDSKYIFIPLILIVFFTFNLTDYVLTDTRIVILLTIIIFIGSFKSKYFILSQKR